MIGGYPRDRGAFWSNGDDGDSRSGGSGWCDDGGWRCGSRYFWGGRGCYYWDDGVTRSGALSLRELDAVEDFSDAISVVNAMQRLELGRNGGDAIARRERKAIGRRGDDFEDHLSGTWSYSLTRVDAMPLVETFSHGVSGYRRGDESTRREGNAVVSGATTTTSSNVFVDSRALTNHMTILAAIVTALRLARTTSVVV